MRLLDEAIHELESEVDIRPALATLDRLIAELRSDPLCERVRAARGRVDDDREYALAELREIAEVLNVH